MKILVITTAFPKYIGDFSGNFIYNLYENMASKGFEVIVLAPHEVKLKFTEFMGKSKVIRFPYFYPLKYQKLAYSEGVLTNINKNYLAKLEIPFLFLSELFHTLKLVKTKNIDIIHSHWLLPSGLVGAICSRVYKIPHVTTVHGSDVNLVKKSKFLNKIANFIFKNSDMITVNSTYTKDILLSIDAKINTKVNLIPMGVDVNCFINQEVCNLKQNSESKKNLLFIGRLIDLKGVEYLILAMNKIVKVFPDASLLIIGVGPERENLERLTKKLFLENNIIFKGYISGADLVEYYNRSDVFVLPSINKDGYTEGLGVVLLEAMSCKTPVVASSVGGIIDIIRDGYNGFLVPEKSPNELANKIIELLSDNKTAEKFRINGFNTVMNKFSWDSISSRFSSMYSQIIGKEYEFQRIFVDNESESQNLWMK